jgi:hypothetical protein
VFSINDSDSGYSRGVALAISTLLALVLCEIVLRIAWPQQLINSTLVDKVAPRPQSRS